MLYFCFGNSMGTMGNTLGTLCELYGNNGEHFGNVVGTPWEQGKTLY
jgi:hypothetical protein